MVDQFWDFPFSRMAFATAQTDARFRQIGPLFFRERGRKVCKLTLIGWEGSVDPAEVQRQLIDLKTTAKVNTVSFIGLPPAVRTRPESEWLVNGPFDFTFSGHSGSRHRKKHRKSILKQMALPLEVARPDPVAARALFAEWSVWAHHRHFMVFEGHYLNWLQRYYQGVKTISEPHLFGLYSDSVLVGLVGYEIYDKCGQFTVMKHSPSLDCSALWGWGLRLISEHNPVRIFCGSTADTLKKRLGMTEARAWRFDI